MTTKVEHDATLRAAAAGDNEALAQLVRAYHERVYRFGLRACRDPFDADDAVQEAFTKLARRPDVQRDAGALSWLMTVVRNACRRLLRSFVRERSRLGEWLGPADTEPAHDPSPDVALERWHLVHRVHEVIAGLSSEYREVLVLRDIEGMSGEEVCRTLEISEAAMKSRLHRAREMVRSQLLGSREDVN
jgi:RNA polymerase sigma-70 factor, ECF subfamily